MENAHPHAPIVLVHGIFGFNQLTLGGRHVADYFRGIRNALQADGHNLPLPPQLKTAGGITERAQDLKNYLEDHTDPPAGVSGERVHLIAHSLGGLDARYMISRLGMAGRILTLTTIGTPHHGSSLADSVTTITGTVLTHIKDHLGFDLTGIDDLTTEKCKQFNAEVPEAADLRYFSVAGQFVPHYFAGIPLGILGPFHDIIQSKEGDNDGLVSVQSAKFGQSPERWEFLGTWEANHFRLINWGANILPSEAESADNSIVDRYRALANLIDPLPL
ncbi:MAG: hypothetical protein HY268_29870 [Deltaproteobacteria bacterium]|nr:hypothetical protein [Deltaproteobacteria bacterium]